MASPYGPSQSGLHHSMAAGFQKRLSRRMEVVSWDLALEVTRINSVILLSEAGTNVHPG